MLDIVQKLATFVPDRTFLRLFTYLNNWYENIPTRAGYFHVNLETHTNNATCILSILNILFAYSHVFRGKYTVGYRFSAKSFYFMYVNIFY